MHLVEHFVKVHGCRTDHCRALYMKILPITLCVWGGGGGSLYVSQHTLFQSQHLCGCIVLLDVHCTLYGIAIHTLKITWHKHSTLRIQYSYHQYAATRNVEVAKGYQSTTRVLPAWAVTCEKGADVAVALIPT